MRACGSTGVVVFAGEETKVRLNATPAPTKTPSMEKMTNKLVVTVFGFLIVLAVVFTVLGTVRAVITARPPS